MTEQTDLARLCLEYRAENDRMTQAELAEKCGVTREIINKIENGKHVSRLTETKIRMAIEGRK